MKINYADLGKRVRQARRQRGITQEILAEQVGISASFMGHIERGTRVASLETLVALCNALECSPDFLLCGSLTFLDASVPAGMTAEDRSKLTSFFRLAQETLNGWKE